MRERDTQGIRNAARYAIQPNMWDFCGDDTSQKILRDFITGKNGDEKIVSETLQKHGFPHLNSFLETISEMSEQDIFDDEVVLSYWIGNFLTEKVGMNTREKLIGHYKKQISEEFARALAKRLPEQIFLTHLSQVALIAAEGYDQVEKTKLINHCMVAHGIVNSVNIEKREATVKRDVLRKNDSVGYLVAQGKQMVKIDVDLTPELQEGDDIAVHLGYLAGKLRPDQAEKLRYWTRKVAAVI